MEKLKVASLFCGCGGTDVGLLGGFDFLGQKYSTNNMEIVYANDIDDNACNIFEENFGIKPDNRDIREVKSEEIPDFDILTGGFPCQSFSIVAQNPKRLGVKDERGKLFFEMCRILREKQPKCFIAENVKGLLTANKRSAFPLIMEEFEKSGYNVTYSILNAAEYGVPQKRERVIIVGFRKDLNIQFSFPDVILKKPLVSVYSGHCQREHIWFLSLSGCALCICSYYEFEQMPDCQYRFQGQIKNQKNEDPLSFHKLVAHSDCVLLTNLSYHRLDRVHQQGKDGIHGFL